MAQREMITIEHTELTTKGADGKDRPRTARVPAGSLATFQAKGWKAASKEDEKAAAAATPTPDEKPPAKGK